MADCSDTHLSFWQKSVHQLEEPSMSTDTKHFGRNFKPTGKRNTIPNWTRELIFAAVVTGCGAKMVDFGHRRYADILCTNLLLKR